MKHAGEGMNIDETGNTRMVEASHGCFRVEGCGDGRSMERKVVSDLPLPSKGKRGRERERKRERERERGRGRGREREEKREREREKVGDADAEEGGLHLRRGEEGGARPTPRGGWRANLLTAKTRRRVAAERLSSAC